MSTCRSSRTKHTVHTPASRINRRIECNNHLDRKYPALSNKFSWRKRCILYISHNSIRFSFHTCNPTLFLSLFRRICIMVLFFLHVTGIYSFVISCIILLVHYLSIENHKWLASSLIFLTCRLIYARFSFFKGHQVASWVLKRADVWRQCSSWSQTDWIALSTDACNVVPGKRCGGRGICHAGHGA